IFSSKNAARTPGTRWKYFSILYRATSTAKLDVKFILYSVFILPGANPSAHPTQRGRNCLTLKKPSHLHVVILGIYKCIHVADFRKITAGYIKVHDRLTSI